MLRGSGFWVSVRGFLLGWQCFGLEVEAGQPAEPFADSVLTRARSRAEALASRKKHKQPEHAAVDKRATVSYSLWVSVLRV